MGITPEIFYNNDEIKVNIFKEKYSNGDKHVDQCFGRIAGEIASVGIEEKSDYWKQRWLQELLDDLWRPGGSVIASTNKKDKKISVFNCTHFAIKSDTLESIYKCRYECSKSAAYRQGLGVEFSKLRPKGTSINNSAEESEGVVHWMKSFDNIGHEVGQKGRRPAMLFSLKVDHPDIEDFIKSKTDLNEINNANISVQLTNDFMDAVIKKTDWELRFDFDDTNKESIVRTVNANDIIDLIVNASHLYAEPGIQFIDIMRQYSIQEALGYIISGTNACSEKPLPEYGVCGLASLNMAKVPHVADNDAFHSFMSSITQSMVRFMDNAVEYELENSFKSPLEEQYKVVKDLREIGLGVTNLHQWLYDQGFEYGSQEGNNAVEKFFKYYAYYAFKSSIRLAKNRNPCDAWLRLFADGDGVDVLKEKETLFLKNLFSEFPDLEALYYVTGIRNGALLSIAPTGTLSMTFSMDILSSGIEPLIGWYYWRKTRAISKGNYDFFFVLPEAVKNIVLDKMKNNENIVPLEDYTFINNLPGSLLDNNGEIGEKVIKIIEQYIDVNLLKSAHEIDPFNKLEMMTRVSKWVDAAISVTYNLPEDFPPTDIKNLYIQAYINNIKALSIYREGSREGILIFNFPKDHKNSVNVPEMLKDRPDHIEYKYAPSRPRILEAEVHNVLKHKVFVGMLDGRPYEMFITENGMNIPKNGLLVRKNKKQYQFKNTNGDILIENVINEEVANEKIQAITRLVSVALRHGAPMDFLCDQLNKCGNSISSYPKILARTLKKYKFLMLEEVGIEEPCTNCGELTVKIDGCSTCLNCKLSKCS